MAIPPKCPGVISAPSSSETFAGGFLPMVSVGVVSSCVDPGIQDGGVRGIDMGTTGDIITAVALTIEAPSFFVLFTVVWRLNIIKSTDVVGVTVVFSPRGPVWTTANGGADN